MYVKSLLAASALFLGAAITISLADVFRAQCKVIWLLGIPCPDVYASLVDQIKAWKTMESCQSGGETCLYELVSTTPVLIKAKHTSPRTKYVDDLQFSLTPGEDDTVCKVNGESVSEAPEDLVENSTNYCSLQNLVEGSGLTSVAGYKQFTNEWICLAYDTANCSAV